MNEATIPPVHLEMDLDCSPEHAFSCFTAQISQWWPLESHSVGQADARSAHFIPSAGGEIYEMTSNGTKHLWGTVESANPPESLVFSWHPGGSPDHATRVEVTFTETETGTRMTITHTGWEIWAEDARERRNGYQSGWAFVAGQRFTDFAHK